MKILILTQYFPPETGAPQNRLFELAVRLKKRGAEVVVLTAMPNYPRMEIHKKFKGRLYAFEEMDELKIHRAYIYISKNRSIVSRLLNYFSFVFTSLLTGLIKIPKIDYIICESPPLFLGISAYLLSRLKRSKMIFNVSDLWPESAEKLGLVKNRFLLKTSKELEEFLYRKSLFVTGQTKGIIKNISERFPAKEVYWLPNGANFFLNDSERYDSDWRKANGFKNTDIIVLYAGIIGYAQGLDVIIRAADKLRHIPELKFILLGDGPIKNELLKMKSKMKTDNVYFLDSVPKTLMPSILQSVDAGIIPLKKLELFLGAIPSKIFELLAMKKPILLGVDGEAKALFIEEGKCGMYFEPEDADDLVKQLQLMIKDVPGMKTMGERGNEYARKNFNIDNIAENFWQKLQLSH